MANPSTFSCDIKVHFSIRFDYQLGMKHVQGDDNHTEMSTGSMKYRKLGSFRQ